MLILEMISMLLVGFGGGLGTGVISGVKLRGWIPLRSPNNKIRLENAQTDKAIAELAVERRKSELELEYIEVKGNLSIADLEGEHKQLTTGKEDETLAHTLVGLCIDAFPGVDWAAMSKGRDIVRELSNQIQFTKADYLMLKQQGDSLLRSSQRFIGNRRMPEHLEYAMTEYTQTEKTAAW